MHSVLVSGQQTCTLSKSDVSHILYICEGLVNTFILSMPRAAHARSRDGRMKIKIENQPAALDEKLQGTRKVTLDWQKTKKISTVMQSNRYVLCH